MAYWYDATLRDELSYSSSIGMKEIIETLIAGRSASLPSPGMYVSLSTMYTCFLNQLQQWKAILLFVLF